MKKNSTFYLFLLLFLGTFVALNAQPILTADNNFPSPGNTYIRFNCNATGINQGPAGADAAWSFNSLTTVGLIDAGEYTTAEATPYEIFFPGTNLAETFNDGTIFFYFDNTDSLTLSGFLQPSGGTNLQQVSYSNPLKYMVYPFAYGDSFSDQAVRTYGNYTGTITTNVTADAYGTLSLPNGTFQNALRVHSTIHTHDVATGSNFIVDDELYEWYIEGHPKPLLAIRYRTVDNNGNIITQAYVDYADVPAAQGGPDLYGYIWENNSLQPGGSCNFIDISGVGTQISGLADDNFSGPIDIGFNFQYYWGTYDKVWVGSNGYISLGSGINIASVGGNFPFIPTPNTQNNFVAPLLCDLNFAGINNIAKCYTYSNNIDTFIVMYKNVPFWVNNTFGYAGSNTFEVIFAAADSSVSFRYADLSPLTDMDPTYQTANVPVTIGIENPLGDIGIQLTVAQIPQDSTCFQFHPPTLPLIEVIDAYPQWNQNERNGGFFLLQGDVVNLTSNIKNGGSADIVSPITVTGEVVDATGTPFGGSYITEIPQLLQGESQLVTAWENFPAIEGFYTYRVSSSTAGDLNAVNNINESELVVVDTTANGEMQLAYTLGDGSFMGQISWIGGGNYNDGVGMYFEPPTYPVKIVGAEFYNVPNAGDFSSGFRTRLYRDNGPNHTPGSIIEQRDVDVSEITPNTWHTVSFDNDTLLLTEGGVYIAWLMGEPGIAIATDVLPPYSRQTYEILDNSWAPYRSANNEDFYMRLLLETTQITPVDTSDTTVAIYPVQHAPELLLKDAYPNPANDYSIIDYELPQNAAQTIFSIFDMTGRCLSRRELGSMPAGTHQLRINTKLLPAGNYVYSLQTDYGIRQKHLLVVK